MYNDSIGRGWYNYSCYYIASQNYSSANSIDNNILINLTPEWRNIGTNDTDNEIQNGEAINLTAEGKDETALDWAWLETNETGVWENKTTYNSPMDMNDAVNTWTWSNFTWLNSSITGETTIQWRIYYNDTYGQENVTTTQSFTVVKTPSYCYLDFNPTSPQTYNTSINPTCNCTNPETTANLYKNGTLVNSENNTALVFPAGDWNYTCNTTTTANYNKAINTTIYTVNKGDLYPQLFVNDSDTWYYDYPTWTNVTCNVTSFNNEASCTLSRDEIQKGTSEVNLLPNGTYT